jgi:hypothetical protein
MARKISVEIVGDASSLQRAFRSADKAGSSFGSRMKSVGKVAGLGLAAGIGLATIAMKKSFDAAIEAEKAQTRLDSAFKSANVSAKERAAAMQTVSKVSTQAALDDEALMDSLGKLTRITGDAASAQKALGVAADIARGRGIELEAATQIVAKAQLGQLGALKRIGIEIPKVTAAQDALKASGDTVSDSQMKAAKAADELSTRQAALASLQKQYAGASEAYGNTAAGAQDRFRVAVENLQESLGQKLLPIVTRLFEWLVTNMPTFERVAKKAIEAVGAAITFLAPLFDVLVRGFQFVARAAQQYWPQIQKAAQDVARWYRESLQPAIENVLAAIRRAWEIFGPAITRVATAAFNAVRIVVTTVMGNIRSAIEIVLAIIRGDWGTAWNELKAIVGRTLTAAVALVRNSASLFLDAAVAIGRRIIEGVLSGLSGLGAAIKDKVEGAIKGALGSLNPFSPVEHGGVIYIGKPIIDGAVDGIKTNAPKMASALNDKVRDAIEKAAATVRDNRDLMKDAWAGYSSDALAVFDDLAAKMMTPAEKALEKMRKAREMADVKGAVTSAQEGLSAAQATGDQEQIVAAQKTLDDALYRQKEFGLEQRAALQRKKQDEETAADRVRFEKWLATRNEQQQKQIVQEGRGQDAIIRKIKSYDPAYLKRGQELAEHLAIGLLDRRGQVVDAALALSRAIADALGVGANVAKASTDTSVNRSTERGTRIPGLAAGGIVTRPTLAMIGEAGPEAVVPLDRFGGGGGTVNVYFPNYVGSRDELIRTVRTGLADVARDNPNIFAGKA